MSQPEEALTGISVKLGRQAGNTYLNCFDIDDVPENSLGLIYEKFRPILGENFYLEQSVSGGYHILFRTENALDVLVNWYLTDKIKLEVLQTDNQAVNVAPTVACKCKYAFSGCPEYGNSRVLQGNIERLPLVSAEAIRDFVATLKPRQKTLQRKGTPVVSISQENKEIKSYMWGYAKPADIERQIKAVFPTPEALLHHLGIACKTVNNPDYIRFYSLTIDDGRNPDAILYRNDSDGADNKWPGYSVWDFHTGELISFGQYLCKFDVRKFDSLMEKIGFGKIVNEAPINCNVSPNMMETIEIGRYPTEQQADAICEQIYQMVNSSNGKQPQIVITAPTGCGKTEMFYRLAESKKLKMIMALAYTGQVEQAKMSHAQKDVITGLCGNDNKVPAAGSIVMTYDKAEIVHKNINPREYIIVVDEAHNLVNQKNFRTQALSNLKKLMAECAAVVFITATPEYLDYSGVDKVIRIIQRNRSVQKAQVVTYGTGGTDALADIITSTRSPGKIDVVLMYDSKRLRHLQEIIKRCCPGISTHLLKASEKDQSGVYKNLAGNGFLTGNGFFENGGILFTTNLIVDGVNILDSNIGNIYLLDPLTSTDLIQFPARFRNGYENYFILVSGKTNDQARYQQNYDRQGLLNRYYHLALRQQDTYRKIQQSIQKLSMSIPYINFVDGSDGTRRLGLEQIQLLDVFDFLDHQGEIAAESILYQVQRIETLRMRYDLKMVQEFMGNQFYGYNFVVEQKALADLITEPVDADSKVEVKEDLKQQIKLNQQMTEDILAGKHGQEQATLLVRTYLKRREKLFPELAIEYKVKTLQFSPYYAAVAVKEIGDILRRYCTGLQLGAYSPIDLIHLSDREIRSIKRVHHNLTVFSKNAQIKQDDKLYRHHLLLSLIRGVKKKTKLEEIDLDIDDLERFRVQLNNSKGVVYHKVGQIKNDLKDMFKVESRRRNITKGGKKQKIGIYIVGEEWTFDNIYGHRFKKPTSP